MAGDYRDAKVVERRGTLYFNEDGQLCLNGWSIKGGKSGDEHIFANIFSAIINLLEEERAKVLASPPPFISVPLREPSEAPLSP